MTLNDDDDAGVNFVRALDLAAGYTPLRVPSICKAIERGYLRGELVFERPFRVLIRAHKAMARLGAKHAQAMAAGELDMVELEFPDWPVADRFFRIGTNPEGMREPMEIDLWRKSR